MSLVLTDLRIALGERVLIQPLDLTIAPGAIVTVMGPSGAGKSALLAAIGGWIDPAFSVSGEIRLDGKSVSGMPPEQRRIGILFQDPLLFPHLSVGENLAFALPAAIRGKAERHWRVDSALAAAELPGYADRDPATLSGGQKARVALLRTLLSEPQALLLDEPFNGLDADLRSRIRTFVFDHARRADLPTLLVTHDEADVPETGGEVVRLG